MRYRLAENWWILMGEIDAEVWHQCPNSEAFPLDPRRRVWQCGKCNGDVPPEINCPIHFQTKHRMPYPFWSTAWPILKQDLVPSLPPPADET